MWSADVLDSWLNRFAEEHGDFLGEDEWKLRNDLRRYPPLFDIQNPQAPAWDHASKIAHEAAQRARELARVYYLQIPDYTCDDREFRRWLENTSYRQALRLALREERVGAALMLLPVEQQRLLYWRYTDRWDDAEVATTLRYTLSPTRPLSSADASRLSTVAYRALCAKLRTIVPVGGIDVAVFFPTFHGGVQ